MTSSRLHKVLPVGLGSRNLAPKAQSGMTLLEVLIAVLLFAVFSGVFMTVTEMLGVLVPASKAPLGDASCNGPALEASCINIAFDQLVLFLEKADNLSNGCKPNPKAIDATFSGGWPDDYQICIYPYQGLPESPQKKPGLFLLQAEATEPAFWRKPVQRLFCRPYHLCVDP